MTTQGNQRILAALQENGLLSVREISERAFVGVSTLTGGGYIKQLREAQKIHIGGWQKTSNGFSTPLYRFGPGIDLPKPKFKAIDRDSLGMARIVAALKQAGPMTYRQVALATGLSHNTIKNARYMDILLEQRRIHITDWQRNTNGPMTAIYADGRGRNAAPPPPMSRAEINCRQRTKQRVRVQSQTFVGQLLTAC